MRVLGPCAACGHDAHTHLTLVCNGQQRGSWLICDAHAACLAAEPVIVLLKCMDGQVAFRRPGLFADGGL